MAITGGAGFIGSRLAERLALEEGAIVRAGVNRWYKAAWVSRAAVSLVRCDVTRQESLRALFDGSEIVFHCAMSGSGSAKKCHRVNVLGLQNVIEAAHAAGVRRIVHFSTVGVHGPHLREGLDESAALRKVGNPYADSKIEAEELFWALIGRYAMDGTVLRPTYVWGPCSSHFTVAQVQQMLAGRFFLVDQGQGACNAVYIDNVVDLAILAGVHPAAVGEAFLVRDPDRVTWREYFTRYAEMIGLRGEELNSIEGGWGRYRSAKWWIANRGIGRPLTLAKKVVSRIRGPIERRSPLLCHGLIDPLDSLLDQAQLLTAKIFREPHDWWSVNRYSASGHIDIAKAQTLLSYEPQWRLDDGMRECEKWLREQYYLPTER